tara:strand:+ start:3055 stop:3540 length:486 start_codon:yes stop_codon:yes gene_type:complete
MIIPIIIIILIYRNANNDKFNVNFVIWSSDKINISRLISYSYISGILISSSISILLNTKNNRISNNYNNQDISLEDNDDFHPIDTYEYNYKDIENQELSQQPAERDIRDTKPTVSVKYRIINKRSYDEKNQEEDMKTNINRSLNNETKKESTWEPMNLEDW